MNFRRNRFLALLSSAVIAMAVLVSQARAQNFGDLVIGFSAASGTGSNTNIMVDLWSVNSFSSAAITGGTYTLANLNADLSSAYGPSWATDSSLTFAIVGVNPVTTAPSYGTYDSAYPKSTVWAGAVEAAPGTA